MVQQKKQIRFIPQILIGIVFVLNIQAGILFFLNPDQYAPAYELSGIPGNVAIAGTGLLFLMWSVPYAFALYNPYKHHSSLIQAVIMQAIGVGGESLILSRIPLGSHLLLRQNIWRFIIFDGIGLLLLVLALYFVKRKI
ncbi:MAG: hypothetical protein CL609_01460 [Anaerolineaceae bacterium]|nr:hypothetical protein [Anaerolineaceae bacterium]